MTIQYDEGKNTATGNRVVLTKVTFDDKSRVVLFGRVERKAAVEIAIEKRKKL